MNNNMASIQSYFDLFELEAKYDLDQQLLQDKYLLKQQLFHPDMVQADAQAASIAKSMLLNEAYTILNDDYKRAEYLLKINGFDLHNHQQLEPDIDHPMLEEIIAHHETLDQQDDPKQLISFQLQQISMQKTLINKLAQAFHAKEFTTTINLTIRLKYISNLIHSIKHKIHYATNSN